MKNEPLSIYRLETLTGLLSEKPVIKKIFHDRFYPSVLIDNNSSKTALNNASVFMEALLFLKDKNLPEIAFQAGLNIEMGSLGILDFYLISCKDVQQAIQAILKYFPLISVNLAAKLNTKITTGKIFKDQNDRYCFHFKFLYFDDLTNKEQLEVEFITGLLINIIKRLTHGNFTIHLNLPYASLPSTSYQLLTENHIEVQLKLTDFELIFKNILFSQPLPFASKKTQNVLLPELDQQLTNLQTHDTIISRILDKLADSNSLQISQMQIAENLNMSESSLKRKLSKSHTSFTNLLNSYKKEMALKLLCSTNLSNEEIATKTGYSDRGTFERAFKKWIGMTPSQFRRQSTFSQINTKPITMADIHGIPPSPEICQQVINLCQTDDFEIRTLADLITTDPVLTGKLMGIANSAFYGGQNISDLQHAIIRVLGIATVQNLTITMMCCQQINTSECVAFDLTHFWIESLATAEASKYFANSPRIKNLISPSELYLAALLHQIGLLALAYLRPDATQTYLSKLKALKDIKVDESDSLENKIFGLPLAEMGALILTHWGLPQTVCQTVRELNLDESNHASRIIFLLSKILNFLQQDKDYSVDDFIINELIKSSGLSKTQLQNQLEKITKKLPEVSDLAQSLAH